MRVNDIALHLRPQSFFQTNTAVAAALYRHARALVDAVAPRSVWDLYCGVGGFGLHAAAPGRSVLGVESSEQAVASAAATATDLGLRDTSWVAGDATAFALGAAEVPDLVIVNPPRRGIGAELAGWLDRSGVGQVLYSSATSTRWPATWRPCRRWHRSRPGCSTCSRTPGTTRSWCCSPARGWRRGAPAR
jgi:23S rRNA (uracil747-C5)-methyltransferase